ncbi:hypothetical protein K2X30_11160 [bacterium]|jgi:hypothetical protein|nr:hypothetical protein [bacterium]
MKNAVVLAVTGLLLIAATIFTFKNYSWVFSRRVDGELLKVERVIPPTAIVSGSNVKPSTLYSFSILIREHKTGEMFSSSSEDRQWAVTENGNCVTAIFFPYPFWQLIKDGTYFNARLEKVKDCPKALPSDKPSGEPVSR